MKRVVMVGYRVRDFLCRRIHDVRSGASLDPFIEVGRLRVLMALLLESGVVVRGDWEMPDVPLASRGAAIDALRSSAPRLLEIRIMDAGIPLKRVERRILVAFRKPIAGLLVEMALLALANETMLASLVETAAKPVRRGIRDDGAFFDPGGLAMRSALHSDPVAFLADAGARLADAKAEVAAAKRRILYLASDASRLADGKPRPRRKAPLPVPLDTAASLASVSAIRGAADDLLRPVEPLVLPTPDPCAPSRSSRRSPCRSMGGSLPHPTGPGCVRFRRPGPGVLVGSFIRDRSYPPAITGMPATMPPPPRQVPAPQPGPA